MSGLSLSQIRTYVARLGEVDDEITRCCHVARRTAKGTKSGALEDACKALEERQGHVREAKEALLEYDAFLHSQKAAIRESLDHPSFGGKAAAFFAQVDARLGPALDDHVSTILEEAVEGLRRVAAELRAVEQAAQIERDTKSCKESVKSLKKTISAAEKAIEKAAKLSSKSSDSGPSADDEVVVEEEVERTASHGYTLTAKVPDFIQEKIDERAKGKGDKSEDDEKDAKKASDHGYVLTAADPFKGRRFRHPDTGNMVLFQSLPPAEQSKMLQSVKKDAPKKDYSHLPPEMRKEQEEWDQRVERSRADSAEQGRQERKLIQEHHNVDEETAKRMQQEMNEEAQRARSGIHRENYASDHGYLLTAKGLPPEFLENAQKKKDEAAAKKDGDEDDGKKASNHGYLLTADSKTPGNESKGPKEEGEEDEGWVPGHRTDGKSSKEASTGEHGYRL